MPRYISNGEEAALHLKSAQRILVVGCSGSGKSTLSRQLSERFGLPHLPMDREFFWLPGWRLRPRLEMLALISKAAAGERWIMDGTSPKTLPLRLPRTDVVIWMRLPRWVSLRGVLLRWFAYWRKTRPDMADDCPEKVDLDFLRYIWNFERRDAVEIDTQLASYANLPVLVLKSHAETALLLNACSTGARSQIFRVD
ncbi:AAA family ATPase [Ensifer adhaerens]|uniref:AAA family ATPase n=1 Tax=Ensifer adhaerens TaxID=106592 RepID=UPI00098F7C01|nr:AAA family ATPase [Ensifer adhaerens]